MIALKVLTTVRKIGNSKYLLLPFSIFSSLNEGKIIVNIEETVNHFVMKIPKKEIRGVYGILTVCFHCKEKFKTDEAQLCETCGWFKCPHCEKCACDLTEKEREILDIVWEAFMGGIDDA